MAITLVEFNFLLEASRRGLLPQQGRLLEFGEADTVFDAARAVPLILGEGQQCDALLAEATPEGIAKSSADAKLIYRAFFDFRSYNAIDLLPPNDYRLQQDLNLPFDLGTQFEVCINNGTTEHVFNQANCYKAIHDHTAPGGVMIHWTPCLGWIDHGLYNVQPGFFHDLARANGYEILLATLSSIDMAVPLIPGQITCEMVAANPGLQESLACVVLRKTTDAPFRFPQQGVYSFLKDGS
jgi:SAM-dependent methyltransferase